MAAELLAPSRWGTTHRPPFASPKHTAIHAGAMPSAVDTAPQDDHDSPLEVEEADLSSDEDMDDERDVAAVSSPSAPLAGSGQTAHAAGGPALDEDDFVVEEEEEDEEDDEDAEEDDDASASFEPAHTAAIEVDGSVVEDELAVEESDVPDDEDDEDADIDHGDGTSADDDDSSGSAGRSRRGRGGRTLLENNDQDGAAVVNDAEDEDDEDVAAAASQSEEDNDGSVVRRRGRPQKLVIPDDMINDDQYFRRSSRARTAPDRLSISPDRSASSVDSDSDFDADDGDDDDDDYASSRPVKRNKSRQTRRTNAGAGGGSRRQRRRSGMTDDDDDAAEVVMESESGSDGDWRNGSASAGTKLQRRLKKHSKSGLAKRRRTAAVIDEDELQSARINSRTGGAVNYAENDDMNDDFLDSDDGVLGAGAQQGAEASDENVPSVERVCDYRASGTKASNGSADSDRLPFDDFVPEDVEFNIKWIRKSFRRNTWERLSTLRHIKGFKRVTNYIKLVLERRDYLHASTTPPEEREESDILMEENRASISAYEAIDRIVAERPMEDGRNQSEYLVKWQNLAYADCTWEPASELSSDVDLKALDVFAEREQAGLVNASSSAKKRYNPFNVKDERPRFRRMLDQPPYLHGEGRTLREYQLAGLNWLAFSWTKRNNVILADEMGLGKTLQTISFLGWLMYERNVTGPFLVVVPLSTIAAWVREFARWLPEMNVVCYIGNGESRSTIRKFEFGTTKRGSGVKFHVLLSTPELIMLDQEYVTEIRWAMLAVDEAHRLKNETSALHLTLASLRSANRLLITGTPLQNSVRELWALLHFLNPDVFADAEAFEDSFSFAALRDPERVSNLHKTLRPFIIRRQKTDVEKSLPKKTYAVLRVGMTSPQQQYYRWLLTKNFAMLNAGNKNKGMGTTTTLRNLVMELKKCCNHPFLFPNYEDTSVTTTVRDLTRASGKMILLDKLLLRLRERGHRVLIFSQMVRMLDILQDYCRMRGFPFQRLDGSMHNDLRQRAVDHYNAPESTDYVFLLSTRAGGLGINLATADTVIIFDSDWNPQNDLQAESRAHRIGQTKDVKVFRLLSRETVEEDILERAKRKRVLEHLVIHGVEGDEQGNGNDTKMAFKKEELSAILRFGAEKLFEKDQGVDAVGKVIDAAGGIADDDKKIDAPTAQDACSAPDDEKAEEKQLLQVDDIDELLDRAPVDEAAQVGSAQPTMGDSLLNAFKWADFKTVEEDEETDGVEPGEIPDSEHLAKEAAERITKIDNEANQAQEYQEQERDMIAKEGDTEFWDRVIPGELQRNALTQVTVTEELVAGTRRRKRTKAFGAESPGDGKRRRVTRTGKTSGGLDGGRGELSAKEKRSLLRSLRKFGDPRMVAAIVKDAGLENRIEESEAAALLHNAITTAREVVDRAQKEAPTESPTNVPNGKDAKTKAPSRTLFDILGETGVDAADLLKRCEDLKMLRRRIASFEMDTQFRLRRPIKAPSYGVPWKPQNDAMLLVGVNRYGFGNWTQIAIDQQLMLGDKMSVAGNGASKKGAPDSTKLTRRVVSLLRELEREVHTPRKTAKARARERPDPKASSKDKRASRVSAKSSGKRHERPSSRGEGPGRTSAEDRKRKRSKTGTHDSDASADSMRSALKTMHTNTLKELRALSKENSKMEASEKIARTKQCLLRLGRAIDKQASTSRRIREELWRYVHQICRTSLAGARLQAIYEKLAAAQDGASSSRAGAAKR